MKIAIVAAGFTPEEADRLRRAMATFRRAGTIQGFCTKMIDGMTARGYDRDFAERCFKQIEGFGEYGFPESHAASFALLVYVSAWIKCHYPAAFACALLNAQPTGFYAPAQIVRDAREHGVEVRPIDVNNSEWDCTLEKAANGSPALRLGFRQAKGVKEIDAAKLVAMRDGGYGTVRDAWRRAGIGPAALAKMARADAWGSVGLDRRGTFWQIHGLGETPLPLFAHAEARSLPGSNRPPPELAAEPEIALPAMTLGEQVVEDYRNLGLTLRRHPCALLRPTLAKDGIVPNADLARMDNGKWVAVSGLVVVRQQPGTASGVIFVTLEDETGVANVIVWPSVFDRFRRAMLESRLLRVAGRLQREGIVIHVVADRFIDLTGHLRSLGTIEGNGEGNPAPSGSRTQPGFDPSEAFPEGRNFR